MDMKQNTRRWFKLEILYYNTKYTKYRLVRLLPSSSYIAVALPLLEASGVFWYCLSSKSVIIKCTAPKYGIKVIHVKRLIHCTHVLLHA